MTLGGRIKTLRKKINITQEEMATRLRIPRGTISNWEIDRSEPDTEMLGIIANFFGVSLDYLILGHLTDYDTGPPGPMNDLTDEEKKHVEQFVEFIKSRRQTENEQSAVSE